MRLTRLQSLACVLFVLSQDRALAACINVTAAHLAAAYSQGGSLHVSPLSQGAESTNSAVAHDGWTLDFCGLGPQAVWVPSEDNATVHMKTINGHASSAEAAVARQDARAARDFAKMLRVLSTFDCSQPYSYFTCDQCRAAYKRWICLMRLPRCTVGAGESADSIKAADPPCLDACTDVLRACPYNIDFSCPSAQSLFGHDYSTDTSKCDSGIQVSME